MSKRKKGGVLHTYQKYDPVQFPSPTAEPPDMVSPLMEQMLRFGSMRKLTPEELARAVRLDPSQISGFGPSIDMIRAILLERKRKLLETYETDSVQALAKREFHDRIDPKLPPSQCAKAYAKATRNEQLADLEQLWFAQRDDSSDFSRHLVTLMDHLANKYQVDELAAKYAFTGKTPLTIEDALEVKRLLEKIDELLKQLDEAEETAQIGVIDLDELAEFVDQTDMQALEEMQRMVENYIREQAERQGLENRDGKLSLTPKALRLFQSKLLDRIFSELAAGRSGRHQGNITGEGAVELTQTKPYEFGDSIANIDAVQSIVNAMVRQGPESPVRLKSEDIVIHKTRNNPKCATVVVMDMSGSMRYDGQYINVKRMALALDGLIRSEYPGDFLGLVEMYTFAKIRRSADIIDLMPKPVTLFQPVVQLKVDMSRANVSEHMVHPHFTNMQHALRLSRQLLAGQDAANKQIIVITDGLPTAHFEQNNLFLLYPPHPQTESATIREALLCQREGITINLFLIPSWSQSEDDIRFAYRLAESATGRVIFTSGNDLDRFVIWDYIKHKRELLG
jgi:uncharacterized protein with von Willebrand factor type A (vWA) domain